MAYMTFLAAIPVERIVAFQSHQTGERPSLQASKTMKCSHLMAYWVRVQPLGSLLGEAIDGGQPLDAAHWHPLRPPRFHAPDAAADLYRRLNVAWSEVTGTHPVADDDWYGVQIRQILDLFAGAAERGEAVVSFLGPPADAERASRVTLPSLDAGAETS